MTARTAKDKTPAKDARQPAAGARPMGVQMEKGETEAATMSRVMLAPFLRHGIVANGIVDKMAGKGIIHKNTAGRYKTRIAAKLKPKTA